MKIVLAGGTGFIGKALTRELLERGHEVVLLTRKLNPAAQNPNPKLHFRFWDARYPGEWTKSFHDAWAVINLAGEGISDQRWTAERKKRILASRVQTTEAILLAIRAAARKPAILLNASAVGYYGNVPAGDVLETSLPGTGFLSETCRAWEKAAGMASDLGVRTAFLRFGIILEKEGGALLKMLPAFRHYFGGHLGTGRQWFPWIHRSDAVSAILAVLENPALSGPVNIVSPHPVQLHEFCAILGKTLRRPSWAHIPAPVLRILLGEMAEMLLTGQRAIPKKLQDFGFSFRYPLLEDALGHILKQP